MSRLTMAKWRKTIGVETAVLIDATIPQIRQYSFRINSAYSWRRQISAQGIAGLREGAHHFPIYHLCGREKGLQLNGGNIGRVRCGPEHSDERFGHVDAMIEAQVSEDQDSCLHCRSMQHVGSHDVRTEGSRARRTCRDHCRDQEDAQIE